MATAPYSYSIIHMPHGEESQKYMLEYKTLRLFALKSTPEAFHSTYARESVFADDVWYDRLSNPAANVFAAFNDSGMMVSMTTIAGPLPIDPHELPVLGTALTCLTDDEIVVGGKPLHFRLNAVFTHPEARRKAVAQSLIRACFRYVEDEVPLSRKNGLVVSVAVELGVLSAKALYEKCGFVETLRIERDDEAYLTNIAMLEYRPFSK